MAESTYGERMAKATIATAKAQARFEKAKRDFSYAQMHAVLMGPMDIEAQASGYRAMLAMHEAGVEVARHGLEALEAAFHVAQGVQAPSSPEVANTTPAGVPVAEPLIPDTFAAIRAKVRRYHLLNVDGSPDTEAEFNKIEEELEALGVDPDKDCFDGLYPTDQELAVHLAEVKNRRAAPVA